MTEMIAVKAICDNDTRRFSIDPALKFAGLKDEILTRFGLSADNLKLKFKGMAPMFMQFGFPGARSASAGQSDESQTGTPEPAVHYGVECDGCQQCPIRGPRFKSTTREDFDLCEACVQKEVHKTDHYNKIDQPADPCRGFRRGGPCGMMRGMMRGWNKGGWGCQESSHTPVDASALPEAPLQYGARGDAVATLQRALI